MNILYILDSPYAFRGGCWFYRNHLPAEALKNRGHDIAFISLGSNIPDKWMEFPDTVVFSRYYPRDPLILMREYKRLGKRVIYEVDDDLWTVNPDNPSVGISEIKQRQYEHLMKEVDAITTTTEILAKKLRKFNKKNLIGNFIDSRGKKMELWFSQNELIDIYLSNKMEENRNALIDNGIYIGDKNKENRVFYPTENSIKKFEEKMTKESKAISDYILTEIKDKSFARKMTDAYEKKYNKPFPFIKNGYWTLNRHYIGTDTKQGDIFNPEYANKAILSPSSFKQRVKNSNPLEIKGALDKFIN